MSVQIIKTIMLIFFSEDYNLENDILLNCITTEYQNDSETKLEQKQ